MTTTSTPLTPNLLPELEMLLQKMAESHGKDVDCTLMNPEEGRAKAAQQNLKWNTDLPVGVRTAEVVIPGAVHPDARHVSGMLFVPDSARPGTILYAHGGGFAFGSPACQSRFTSLLAKQTGLAVLSLHYQLAPEASYPAGLHDMIGALRFLQTDQEKLGLQAGPVLVAGESAGANLALSALVHEIRVGTPAKLAGALFICGCFQNDPETLSARAFRVGPGLTMARMSRYWAWYNPERRRTEATMFPLQASDIELSQLPPLALYAAGVDPLLSDSTTLYDRCMAIKHPVTLEVVPQVMHGFIQMSRDLIPVQNAIRHMTETVQEWTRHN